MDTRVSVNKAQQPARPFGGARQAKAQAQKPKEPSAPKKARARLALHSKQAKRDGAISIVALIN